MEKLFYFLACQLRLMNLFYHNQHNLAKGIAFESDHELFLEFYEKMDDDYDDVVERSIGMGMSSPSNLALSTQHVAEKIKDVPVDKPFETAEQLEKILCDYCKLIDKDGSIGVKQLVGEIANQSEIRQYKIKQRLS